MDKLPNDILEIILFRLPVKPALQARQVCRTWRNLLANRRYEGFLFTHTYGTRSSKELQLYYGEQYDHIHVDWKNMNYYYSYHELIKLKHGSLGRDLGEDRTYILVGSCNGLVCFRIRNERFLICNPLTGEAVLLPTTGLLADDPITVKACGFLQAFGFGYCRSTDYYKVVRMHSSGEGVAHVHACTIGSGWRNIASIPNHLRGSGIFVNGALHWRDWDDTLEYTIFVLDLEDEKFRSLPKPPSEVQYYSHRSMLRLLGGSLCSVQTDVEVRTNIWVYKRNNNMKGHDQKSDYYDSNSWNWIKEFSIKTWDQYFWEPFAITKSNEVLLWRGQSILFCYDPVTSTLNQLWYDYGIGCSEAAAIPHTISFISLKYLVENGFGDCKYIQNGHRKIPKKISCWTIKSRRSIPDRQQTY